MKKIIMGALMLGAVISTQAVNAQKLNTLSSKEKKQGWKLLFDGTSTNGWHSYNQSSASPAWKVVDGAIALDQSAKKNGAPGGDLVTNDEYENYEFTIDWKISEAGNSGVIFSVHEDPSLSQSYLTGPEMQVLDDDKHPDGKNIKHNAGDLYDMIQAPKRMAKPVGQWNTAKIIKKDGHLTLWLNGTKTAETTMGTPEWDALVAGSKFKNWKEFGKYQKGRIALQDHGNDVWYRNIKIREL
ncbi:DUF1080 domain-containing protein [Chitinophaga silvatica]|uniref:DUF1080 domain-containing protein n=1 Tax=Chitinophaga silvatica TaxID=2282649 RepID=A0A3E1YAB0_9BACT|nr:DUF1080 domain-containing protein [Chitinophaga silvatica]RFS22663.1 DUF1080 domain-containing protein [Chitinophaga silvatica]